jgi:hypothetical protein
MADTLSALLGYDSALALKGGFIAFSPWNIFNRIANSVVIIKKIIPL